MKIKLFLILKFLLCVNYTFSQHYFIAFTDKPVADSIEIIKHLSTRSIERRANQNIAFSTSDYPINLSYVDSLTSYNLTPIFKSKWLNGVLVKSENAELIAALKSKNYIAYIHNLQTTSVGGVQSYDSSNYAGNWYVADFLGIQNFHNNNNWGQGKLIAIFDAGFSGVDVITPFKHLFEENKLVDTYNFVKSNTNVFESASHGTNVLSIISAFEDGKYIGIAPQSEIALYNTENIASESILEEYNWLFAAERADSLGVDLINSSLGYYDFDYPSTNHTFGELDGNTSIISRAANLASEKGILVINSAGNSNGSSFWPHINFPADAEKVLTVGSVNSNLAASTFSSRGPINNTSIKPEVVMIGENIAILNQNGDLINQSGTSFSAPSIAGLCALVWNKYPTMSAQELKQFIIENSSNFDSPNYDIGYGYPNFKTVLKIENKYLSTPIKIEYLDLNGRLLSTIPLQTGIYIKKSTFENQSITIEKIYIP